MSTPQIEEFYALQPIPQSPRERFKPSRVGLFSKAKREQKPQLTAAHNRLLDAKQLVESDLWTVVLKEAEAFIYERRKDPQDPGYVTGCMTRDILEDFIARIERAAQAAPDTAAFALPGNQTAV